MWVKILWFPDIRPGTLNMQLTFWVLLSSRVDENMTVFLRLLHRMMNGKHTAWCLAHGRHSTFWQFFLVLYLIQWRLRLRTWMMLPFYRKWQKWYTKLFQGVILSLVIAHPANAKSQELKGVLSTFNYTLPHLMWGNVATVIVLTFSKCISLILKDFFCRTAKLYLWEFFSFLVLHLFMFSFIYVCLWFHTNVNKILFLNCYTFFQILICDHWKGILKFFSLQR